jgi:5-methyltetrahydropteroyltriglutamate--homocysteine methyltransferase
MSRRTPPFKADHVGSLLRPKRLLETRAGMQSGTLPPEALRAVEDEEIRRAVALQKDVGLKLCTDGDFRRRHWFMDFIERIDGIRFGAPMPVRFKSADGSVEFSPPQMELYAPLKRTQSLTSNDFALLKPIADAAGLVAKSTIPSPTLLHFRSTRSRQHSAIYPDVVRLYDDIARVYREEIAGLYAAGCRYLQIDEVNFAYLCDPKLREQVQNIGSDPNTLPKTYAKLINDSIAGKPADMVTAMHLCRGNFKSAWVAEGGYEPVADVLFNQINVDAYFLEYDDERSGDFAPLRFVPKGKTVILGLVTTKLPQLETKDALKRRIEEAAKYCPLDQLALSPQCGFSSTIEGNEVTVADEVAKLKLVVDTAREVWG